MATSSSPFRRVGGNSWQELLDQVNAELVDPEEGCDPLPTIDTKPSPQRWSKADIREVHDRLDQMDTNCFTFQSIPDLWKVSIISDIENQLGNSWCDCEGEEQCCEPCPNTFERAEIIIGMASCCTGCITPCQDNTICTSLFCQRDNCGNAQTGNVFSGYDKYTTNKASACALQVQIDDLQDEIDALQDEIDQLDDEISNLNNTLSQCQAGPQGDPCRAGIQAQIDAKEEEKQTKEDEKSEKETEKSEKEGERDTDNAEADEGLQEAKDVSDQKISCAQGCCNTGFDCKICFVNEIPTECPFSTECECDTVNPCCGSCWGTCDGSWAFQVKHESPSTFRPRFRTHFAGLCTSDGTVILTSLTSRHCSCNNGAGCCCSKLTSPPSACSDCDPTTGGRCPSELFLPATKTWRWTPAGPSDFDPFDCEGGGPCDGVPGTGGIA